MTKLVSLFSLTLLLGISAFADHHGAKSAETYPLKICVVSDEKLGEMGDIVHYSHQVAGQPDREVQFCCKMCISSFKADPAKYLAKIAPPDLGPSAAATETAGACCAGDACKVPAPQAG